MASALEQRKHYGHQSFTAPRSFCCESIHIWYTLRRVFKLSSSLFKCYPVSFIITELKMLTKKVYAPSIRPAILCMTITDFLWHLEKVILLNHFTHFSPSEKNLKSQKHPNTCKVPSLLPGSVVTWKWFSALIWAGFFHSCAGDTTSESSDALYLSILVRSVRFTPALYHNSSVSKSPFLFHWSEHRKNRIIGIVCKKDCLGHHRVRTPRGKWSH